VTRAIAKTREIGVTKGDSPNFVFLAAMLKLRL
jgi:hypothetical protein